ncbi:MAG: hypothetical protein Q8O83_04480 [bacterium]|nr:hypothetical protein [bacterium]
MIMNPAGDRKDSREATSEQLVRDALYDVACTVSKELDEPITDLHPRKWVRWFSNDKGNAIAVKVVFEHFPDVRSSTKQIARFFKKFEDEENNRNK